MIIKNERRQNKSSLNRNRKEIVFSLSVLCDHELGLDIIVRRPKKRKEDEKKNNFPTSNKRQDKSQWLIIYKCE